MLFGLRWKDKEISGGVCGIFTCISVLKIRSLNLGCKPFSQLYFKALIWSLCSLLLNTEILKYISVITITKNTDLKKLKKHFLNKVIQSFLPHLLFILMYFQVNR